MSGYGSPPTPGPRGPRGGGEFLQAQIARQQADGSSGSWLEDLTAALDYRSWHEFGIERQQHGKWVSATGPASGGERVLAVSVPLFAAASSHYASARGRTRPGWSPSTRRSPEWTTTRGPSASDCCTPSTSTSS
ncbi:SbcC/MukB-like Walker B domain-containing protein [Streptomyces sp. M19]